MIIFEKTLRLIIIFFNIDCIFGSVLIWIFIFVYYRIIIATLQM